AGQSLVTFGLEQLAGSADVEKWAGGKRALVIGAGSMSSLAATTLVRAGVAELAVANRTVERAERLVQILTEPGGPGAASGMAADVDKVRGIVSDEVAAFGAAQRAAHITPTVVALRTMAADVVTSEIARLDGRLPDLDDKQRAEITQTVRRVVDKLLHAPTVR